MTPGSKTLAIALVLLAPPSLVACGADGPVGDPGDDDDDDVSVGDDDDDMGPLPTSCADALATDPSTPSGVLTIDPDGDGGAPPFDVACDMDQDGGGWTLVGVVDNGDTDGWTDFATWSSGTTFGVPTGGDYKSEGWSGMPAGTLRLVGSGTKISDALPGGSLAELFSSTTLISLTGTERDWRYDNGDFTLERDAEFFLEVQNPPTTLEVNSSERNACVLATAYDGWDRGSGPDDQVGGFGCVPGFGEDGVGDGLCGNDSCGDTSRETATSFYVR